MTFGYVPAGRRFRGYQCPRCGYQVFLTDPAPILTPAGGLRRNDLPLVAAMRLHIRVGCSR